MYKNFAKLRFCLLSIKTAHNKIAVCKLYAIMQLLTEVRVLKILILSCFTGEGHNSAAKAVAARLEIDGHEAVIADPVAFSSDKAQHFISSFYNNMIRKRPSAFGLLYKAGAIYTSTKLPSPVYYANSSYSEALGKYITENNFDAVVCTHLYGMEAMTAVRKHNPDSVPCFGVLTDYTCIPFMKDTKLDIYFAPCSSVAKELSDCGIPKEAIITTGIPVNPAFSHHTPKQEARRMLELPEDKHIILIMTGGIGCENMLELCKETHSHKDDDTLILVLVGHNNSLADSIAENFGENNGIITVPFTDKVALYMNAADVLMSKSGGLSSTEAAVANIPFIIVNAIPGCESKNAAYFEAEGMAINTHSNKEAAQNALSLIHDPARCAEICRRQRLVINSSAAKDIVERITAYEGLKLNKSQGLNK